MRRVLPLLLLLAALPAAGPAATRAFTYGVAAGEVTPQSALLWAHAERTGAATVEVARNARFRPVVATRRAVAQRANDNTLQVRVSGLTPGSSYFYRFRMGPATSPVGRFETAPPPSEHAVVRFAISGDADGSRLRNGRPGFNRFEVYAAMAAERNDFNLVIGDTIYSDSSVGGRPPALSVPTKWAKYKQNLGYPNFARLRSSTGSYSHWDDHEFVNDFTRAEHGEAVFRAGVKAFRDYAPVTYSSRDGLYRTFRWGRNVELFFLDERSFRSAKASEGGVCGSPPDLAPTAPKSVRDGFSQLIPSLAQPPPPGCIERIRDPSRTMLGAAQKARFLRAVARSTATFKVVVNEVPIHQFYALPYDRWEGYEAERLELLRALQASGGNVVFLTTDVHANLVGEVRLATLEVPSPIGTGMLEAATGPVATNTYAREVDAVIGRQGVGDFITSVFFKPAPPRGVGFACAATDVYSYAEVLVTSQTLTITPKNARGEGLRDKLGERCGPFTVRAR